MKAIHIWGRELGTYVRSPLGVAVPAMFLLLSGYFFYSELVFFVLWGGESLSNDLWRFVFLDMRLVLLLLIPLITMRQFAEERKLGTIELLWTYPVTDWEIVAGKFLAALSILLAIVAPTILYPCVLALLHPVAPGPLIAAYMGLLLLGTAFIACGMAASSVTDSQLVSAVLTYALLLLFWFLTWNEAVASEGVMRILLQVSLFDRFYGFASGVIDTEDVVYFVAFAAFFLFLTVRILQSRNWRGV